LLCEEEGRRRVRCEMDKIKTTKGQQLSTLDSAGTKAKLSIYLSIYQHLAGQDLL
jgi:hypothetical protein